MSDFAALLADLDAIDGDPRTKRRVRDLLARYAGRRLYICITQADLRSERLETVERLTRAGYSRSELIGILAERWGITRAAVKWWLKNHA